MWVPLSKLLAVPSTRRFLTKCFQLRFGRTQRRHSNATRSYFPFSIATVTNYLLWKNAFLNSANVLWFLIIFWIRIKKKRVFFSHIEIVWENNGTKSPNAWKKGKKSETVLWLVTHVFSFLKKHLIKTLRSYSGARYPRVTNLVMVTMKVFLLHI